MKCHWFIKYILFYTLHQKVVQCGISKYFSCYRDDPKEMPVFVASNVAKDNGTIAPRGENIFGAVK